VNGTPAQRFVPPTSDAALPFWNATRDRRLELQWCGACQTPIHYPREVCPACLRTELQWRPATGSGTIYAFTVEHHPADPRLAAMAPFVIALVDLAEGVRMATNIVECPIDAVAVGMEVEVGWVPLPDGRHLPVFKPTRPSTAGQDPAVADHISGPAGPPA
jgi:uncharacterized protein